eukprot:SAG22_NODE_1815_length_3518_cov_3.123720_1_plen_569_part_00
MNPACRKCAEKGDLCDACTHLLPNSEFENDGVDSQHICTQVEAVAEPVPVQSTKEEAKTSAPNEGAGQAVLTASDRLAASIDAGTADGRSSLDGGRPQKAGGPSAAEAHRRKRQQIGERLYPHVRQSQPELAGKITGMLLELDDSELMPLLDSKDLLENKIGQAVDVLAEAAQRAVAALDGDSSGGGALAPAATAAGAGTSGKTSAHAEGADSVPGHDMAGGGADAPSEMEVEQATAQGNAPVANDGSLADRPRPGTPGPPEYFDPPSPPFAGIAPGTPGPSTPALPTCPPHCHDDSTLGTTWPDAQSGTPGPQRKFRRKGNNVLLSVMTTRSGSAENGQQHEEEESASEGQREPDQTQPQPGETTAGEGEASPHRTTEGEQASAYAGGAATAAEAVTAAARAAGGALRNAAAAAFGNATEPEDRGRRRAPQLARTNTSRAGPGSSGAGPAAAGGRPPAAAAAAAGGQGAAPHRAAQREPEGDGAGAAGEHHPPAASRRDDRGPADDGLRTWGPTADELTAAGHDAGTRRRHPPQRQRSGGQQRPTTAAAIAHTTLCIWHRESIRSKI